MARGRGRPLFCTQAALALYHTTPPDPAHAAEAATICTALNPAAGAGWLVLGQAQAALGHDAAALAAFGSAYDQLLAAGQPGLAAVTATTAAGIAQRAGAAEAVITAWLTRARTPGPHRLRRSGPPARPEPRRALRSPLTLAHALETLKPQTSNLKLPAFLLGPWPLLGLAGVSLLNATPAQGIVLLGLGGWWAGQVLTGRLARPLPWAAGPASALLALALLGLLISPDWQVSLPKLAGLWLDLTIGAAAFWTFRTPPPTPHPNPDSQLSRRPRPRPGRAGLALALATALRLTSRQSVEPAAERLGTRLAEFPAGADPRVRSAMCRPVSTPTN